MSTGTTTATQRPTRVASGLAVCIALFALWKLGASSLALVPARGTGSRSLVKVGTALIFVGVLASGIFNAVTLGTLLLAGAATVVAWDAGEHAINVGEHLGRGRDTREIEVVHVVGTGLVAFVAVEAAKFSGGVGPSDLSLASLVLLLVAIVLLAVALHD
jgi:hypothetical protein